MTAEVPCCGNSLTAEERPRVRSDKVANQAASLGMNRTRMAHNLQAQFHESGQGLEQAARRQVRTCVVVVVVNEEREFRNVTGTPQQGKPPALGDQRTTRSAAQPGGIENTPSWIWKAPVVSDCSFGQERE